MSDTNVTQKNDILICLGCVEGTMVAWIITAVPGARQEIITILNYRLSGSKVGKIMEQLYVDQGMGLRARVEYAKNGNTRCPARNSLIDGVPYSEELVCGSGDRFFWARKVNDLREVTNQDGKEQLIWNERKRPDFSDLRELLGPSISD